MNFTERPYEIAVEMAGASLEHVVGLGFSDPGSIISNYLLMDSEILIQELRDASDWLQVELERVVVEHPEVTTVFVFIHELINGDLSLMISGFTGRLVSAEDSWIEGEDTLSSDARFQRSLPLLGRLHHLSKATSDKNAELFAGFILPLAATSIIVREACCRVCPINATDHRCIEVGAGFEGGNGLRVGELCSDKSQPSVED